MNYKRKPVESKPIPEPGNDTEAKMGIFGFLRKYEDGVSIIGIIALSLSLNVRGTSIDGEQLAPLPVGTRLVSNISAMVGEKISGDNSDCKFPTPYRGNLTLSFGVPKVSQAQIDILEYSSNNQFVGTIESCQTD